MDIFKAYDIRGIYGKNLTDDIALEIGKSLGTFLGGNKDVCIGFDTRSSSPNLFNSLASGLISTGCNVIPLGMVPNPVSYFFAWKNKMYGCYVTASHNPAKWNGIKIFKPNGVSFIEETKSIENIFNSKNFLSGEGKLKEERGAIKNYTNFLKNKLGKLKGKIVVDFLGGAGLTASETFKKIGLDIIPLHDKPDASLYGFHKLEPLGSLLNSARRTVKKEKADFGVVFDCDADRSIFIDPSGTYLNPSVMNAVFIEFILERKKTGEGKVISTYDCASELEKFTKDHGGSLIWWRVGHGFIEQKCLEEKALFAGEQSSHFFFNEIYPFSDGILSTLYLAKILNETGKSLDELVNRVKLHPVEKVYIDAETDKKKDKAVEELKKDFPNSTDVMDGFKIKLNDIEWVLIRSSQTLPEINLCAEGKSEKRLKEIVQKYSNLINRKLRRIK